MIETWSPIYLPDHLIRFHWKSDTPHVRAITFWDDTLKYLYLPRLKSRGVLEAAVRTGSASRDFFGTAYGSSNGKYEGFQFGYSGVSLHGTLLLIEPKAAQQHAISLKKLIKA